MCIQSHEYANEGRRQRCTKASTKSRHSSANTKTQLEKEIGKDYVKESDNYINYSTSTQCEPPAKHQKMAIFEKFTDITEKSGAKIISQKMHF